MNPTNRETGSWFAFGLVMAFILAVASLYFYNIVKWADEPQWGFFFRSGSAIDVIGGVREKGRHAGMLPGDRILSINGKTFRTIEERRSVQKYRSQEKNTYLIDRGGVRFEVTITNTPIGFYKSFQQSGFLYLTGLGYVLIGILVFLMMPHRHESWVFYVFAACLGLLMTFLIRSGHLKPAWFNTIHIFLYAFAPATILHLALVVPEKRNLVTRYPMIQLLPYVASLLLFVGLRSFASEMLAVSRTWFLILLSYLVSALLVFILSCVHWWLRSPSEITRVRAKLILIGAVIAISVPVADMVAHTLLNVYLVPGFNYYLPFLVIFPLTIGYTITRHNLFDIDAVIRRTFGYTLITAGLALVYTLAVFASSDWLGSIGQEGYNIFLFGVILFVVLVFDFFRKRIQKIVDRIFFRLEYDYRETIEKISRSMSTFLNIDQIVGFMLDFSENVLFAGRSCVMLLNRRKHIYEPVGGACSVAFLEAGEPFIQQLAGQKREITRYDIDENPLFAMDRQACKDNFNRLGASLIVPLIYENHLTGFLALSRKKSGRFYQYADVLLLKTLANQAAVALENARLFTDLEEQTARLLETNLKLKEEIAHRREAEAQLSQHKRQLEERVARQRIELEQRRQALAALEGDINKGHRFRNIIGKSEPMQAIYTLIRELADVSATVLITGESGTGKELAAEALHVCGRRKDQPFVKVNCAALSESVLESELFGHVKGAFTGADKDKIGRFQKAAYGTILLDECGDVSIHFQKRLLRVLQEHEFEPEKTC
ncbi:MAG: hypothetical protein B6I22_13300 [Desulfobacteraceae bacterium 4572_123]|nr:MAG: hypothetical protein B6I22_13300 [Desulfobacteraceae bacterium 4572_123]